MSRRHQASGPPTCKNLSSNLSLISQISDSGEILLKRCATKLSQSRLTRVELYGKISAYIFVTASGLSGKMASIGEFPKCHIVLTDKYRINMATDTSMRVHRVGYAKPVFNKKMR